MRETGHLVTTGIIEEKHSRGKQCKKMGGQTKWLDVRRITDALIATKD